MIKILEIENFKSIQHLRLDCRKINLFIGEPNTGKSNILETIGVLSHVVYGNINRFVRFQDMKDLFYDHLLENKLNITFDEKTLEVTFKDGSFIGEYSENISDQSIFHYDYMGEERRRGG